jgi:hypothetical protein
VSDDIRIIKSKVLSKAQKELLDAAPILDPDTLDAAIIGTVPTSDGHAAVYDFEKLVEAMMEPGTEREDVLDWISYNTIRALPYMGERAPWILEELHELEFSCADDDEGPVRLFGKSWWRHK